MKKGREPIVTASIILKIPLLSTAMHIIAGGKGILMLVMKKQITSDSCSLSAG